MQLGKTPLDLPISLESVYLVKGKDKKIPKKWLGRQRQGAIFLRPLAFMCGSEDVGKIGGGKIPGADRRSVSARKT